MDSEELHSNLSFALTALIAIAVFFIIVQGEPKSRREEELSSSNPAMTSEPSNPAMTASSGGYVLLLGVDSGLFQSCFGQEDQWAPYRIECLAEDCAASRVQENMDRADLKAIVIQDDTEHRHWNLLKDYYRQGGSVIYFGIYGEFQAPTRIGAELGFEWKFSGYTRHEYVVTDVAREVIGDAIAEQQYSKANLLSVPREDRWMVPRTLTVAKYIEEWEGLTAEEDGEDYQEELERITRDGTYRRYCEENENQCPLAVHGNVNGGKFAYLGFVNGDGKIPNIVRALLTGQPAKE